MIPLITNFPFSGQDIFSILWLILYIGYYLSFFFFLLHQFILLQSFVLFYCCSVPVVPISPHCSSLPHPTPAPKDTLLPIVLVRWSFVPVPFLSPFIPLPSGHVSLFFISMSLVLLCSFVLLIKILSLLFNIFNLYF